MREPSSVEKGTSLLSNDVEGRAMTHVAITDARVASDVLLKPGEVGALFDVTPKTLARWHRAGILPAFRTAGGHRRFPAGAVYDLLDALDALDELDAEGER